MTTALYHLSEAAATLAQRSVDYDRLNGERSMDAAVTAWSAITGRPMSTAEGWLLMVLLKGVRAQTAADPTDSLLDLTAYTALMAEATVAPPDGVSRRVDGPHSHNFDPPTTGLPETEDAHTRARDSAVNGGAP
jgi:hypothetical protein